MAAFFAIVLGAACVFYGYVLAQFGREIKVLRSQRNRGVPLVVPFRAVPESGRHPNSGAGTKVTVLPVNSLADRDVA